MARPDAAAAFAGACSHALDGSGRDHDDIAAARVHDFYADVARDRACANLNSFCSVCENPGPADGADPVRPDPRAAIVVFRENAMADGARPGCGDRPRNVDTEVACTAVDRAHAYAADDRHVDRADRDAAARSLDSDAVGVGAGACGGDGSRHIHADSPVTAVAVDENRSAARGADCLRADGNLVAASTVSDVNSAGSRRNSVGRHQPGGADGDGPAAAAVDVNPGAGLRADRNGHDVDVAAAAGIRHVNSAAVRCGAHGGQRAARPHLDIARSGVVRMQRASARHADIARPDIEVAAAACGGDSVAALRRSRRGDGTGRNQPDVRGPAGFNDDSAAARRADDACRDIDVSSAAADRDCVAVCGGSRGSDQA